MKRLLLFLSFLLIGSALCGQTVHNSKYSVKKGRIVFDTPKRARGQQSMLGFAAEPIPVVRVGIIGLGMRGPGAVTRLGFIDNVEIRALCDLYPERIEENQRILEKAGMPRADAYSGEEGWKQLCERDDLDLVYIVTPWLQHVPMAVYAMTAYGICFPAGSVSATLVPLLLILGSTQMIAAFKRSYQFEHVFKSAFCIGLLPMLYAPALPLVLIVPVTLVLYRRTLREAVVAAAGLLLPFFICSVVWWGLGDSFGLMGHELLAGTTLGEDTALPAFFGEKGVWSKVYIGLFAALTLCSAIIILRTLSSLRTRAKKIHIHFLWLLLLCLISLLLPGNTIASLGVLAVPCCVTVSAFFIRYRGWLPLAIYTVLTALMLYINLFPGV